MVKHNNRLGQWRSGPALCAALLLLLPLPLYAQADDDCSQLVELCRASCPQLPATADDSRCANLCAAGLAECLDSGLWPSSERPVAGPQSVEELNVSILQWREQRRSQLLAEQARFAELRDLFELLPEPIVGQRFISPHLTLLLTAGGELVQLDAVNNKVLKRQRLADECEQLAYGPPLLASPPLPVTTTPTAPAISSKPEAQSDNDRQGEGGKSEPLAISTPPPAVISAPVAVDLALLCSAADGRYWRWQQGPASARRASANWTTTGLLWWQPVPTGWLLQRLAPGTNSSQPLWQLAPSSNEPQLLASAADGRWLVFAQDEHFGLLRAGQALPQPLTAEQLLVDDKQRLLQREGDNLVVDKLRVKGLERLYQRRLPADEQSLLAALPGGDLLLLAHVDTAQDAWQLSLYDHKRGVLLGSGLLADLSPFEQLSEAQVSEDGLRVYLALGDERWLEIDPQRLRPEPPKPAATGEQTPTQPAAPKRPHSTEEPPALAG